MAESKDSENIKLNVNLVKKLVKSKVLYYAGLIPILILAFFIRTRNLELLRGKYLLGLDPYWYLRLTQHIVETGQSLTFDTMRQVPIGVTNTFDLLPHVLAYMHKLISIFSPDATLISTHIIYPAVFAVIGLIFFFLFVKELFNVNVALVSTAFLATVPAYLFRTMSGFADHEALAMALMFAAFYVFILSWKKFKDFRVKLGLAALSGILTGLMALTWSGYRFLSISIALFMIGSLFLSKPTKRQFWIYSAWFAPLAILFTLAKGLVIIKGYGILVPLFALVVFLLYLLVPKIEFCKRFERYAPRAVIASVSALLLSVPVLLFGFVNLSTLIDKILHPVGTSRLVEPVSEQLQPYFSGTSSSWMSSLGIFFLFAFVGSIYMFFKIFKASKKASIIFTTIFAVFFGAIILGRLSPNENVAPLVSFFTSTFLFWVGISLVGLFIAYIYLYKKHNDDFEAILSDNKAGLLLAFTFFILTAVMARSLIRLIFVFAPAAAIVGSYFIVKASEDLFSRKTAGKAIALGIVVLALVSFGLNTANTLNSAEHMGSSLPGQWETSFNWIQESTPESAVISHWWDYGYWTQTVGERASVQDGGKPGGDFAIYLLARYGMLAKDDTQGLTYFKTHNTTHILFSEEEIGKYHAFSFIGSNENLDLESTIGTFGLQQSREVRSGEEKIYAGGWRTDDNIKFGTVVLPRNRAVLGGIVAVFAENKIVEAKAIFGYNNLQYEADIKCACDSSGCHDLPVGEDYVDSCIKTGPSVAGSLGVADVQDDALIFYLSEKTKDTLFTRLYILGETVPGYTEVYTDHTPLGVYSGRIVGPIKIWEINYPSSIQSDDCYLGLEKCEGV